VSRNKWSLLPLIVVVMSGPCSAPLPKQDDFRNFLMGEECLHQAQMACNLAGTVA
jgi:hypothetical protein